MFILIFICFCFPCRTEFRGPGILRAAGDKIKESKLENGNSKQSVTFGSSAEVQTDEEYEVYLKAVRRMQRNNVSPSKKAERYRRNALCDKELQDRGLPSLQEIKRIQESSAESMTADMFKEIKEVMNKYKK